VVKWDIHWPEKFRGDGGNRVLHLPWIADVRTGIVFFNGHVLLDLNYITTHIVGNNGS
jgi:hypothetical protein